MGKKTPKITPSPWKTQEEDRATTIGNMHKNGKDSQLFLALNVDFIFSFLS